MSGFIISVHTIRFLSKPTFGSILAILTSTNFQTTEHKQCQATDVLKGRTKRPCPFYYDDAKVIVWKTFALHSRSLTLLATQKLMQNLCFTNFQFFVVYHFHGNIVCLWKYIIYMYQMSIHFQWLVWPRKTVLWRHFKLQYTHLFPLISSHLLFNYYKQSIQEK